MNIQLDPRDNEFRGRRVVITGAGGGLGRLLVSAFADRGAEVIACDRSASALAGVQAHQRKVFDLVDTAAVAHAAEEIVRDATPDIVVNNAGASSADSAASLTLDAIRKEIDLNLTGVMTLTARCAEAMGAAERGSIVFVSSVNALQHFGNPAYSAAKAGINAYSRALAVEYGRQGLRSNVVCPGSIHTAAWDHRIARDSEILDRVRRLYPLARLVRPSEVVETVLFLASPRASGITGVALPVDAGLTAGSLPFLDELVR
ncbi:NAD(P)-dependent dehydrogenase (short-subunit alcohol dehydrogenase family) [Microbacterium sp. W4I4]|uniref:SDR family oxidoreductase n=1 Tax=Microbacterium sp. W4I4 TaxID=3042295 RepID=UPI0027845B01|nr:SDR family oxidoreductase [Microbacterium sp. W4I4]MDQ0614012.1 NAD(P)-dependent dehydrogenase (short-subunit alcohol dehydrogenase family) [Microbacterium sp. W4I4]